MFGLGRIMEKERLKDEMANLAVEMAKTGKFDDLAKEMRNIGEFTYQFAKDSRRREMKAYGVAFVACTSMYIMAYLWKQKLKEDNELNYKVVD